MDCRFQGQLLVTINYSFGLFWCCAINSAARLLAWSQSNVLDAPGGILPARRTWHTRNVAQCRSTLLVQKMVALAIDQCAVKQRSRQHRPNATLYLRSAK